MNSLASTFVFANLIGNAAAAWRMPFGSSYLRRASVVQDATKRVLPAYPFGRFTEWKDVDKETQELAKLFLECKCILRGVDPNFGYRMVSFVLLQLARLNLLSRDRHSSIYRQRRNVELSRSK